MTTARHGALLSAQARDFWRQERTTQGQKVITLRASISSVTFMVPIGCKGGP